jgi:tetratricopeptide (TPR) repeat protein
MNTSAARSLSRPFLLAMLVVLLQGCAGAPTASAPASTTAPAPTQTAATPGPTKADKILTRTPITPQLQADLDAALALIKAEQYEQGVEAFKKLALAMPDNAVPPTNLALAYQKLGKPERAEEQLKQALELEPDNPVAANELALHYRRTGRFAQARTIYEQLLARHQNFQIARKNLAVLCDLYLRDLPCALSHYKIYAQNEPHDKSVAIWIADVQKRAEKK